MVDVELKLLKEQCYNPFVGSLVEKDESEYEIDPNTGFTKALELASGKLVCDKHTKEDINSMMNFFNGSLLQLSYSALPIYTIRRRLVKIALADCGILKEKWSAATFNKYRSYLTMLFVELVENDAIESNPLRDFKKMKTVRKLRITLDEEERRNVDLYLRTNYYSFWRFMQIFFHSGGRIVSC